MTPTFRLLLAFNGTLLLAVGLLLGQQIQRSKFEKYLRPTTVTSMQLAMLEANLELIREQTPMGDDIGVPYISYVASCRCFSATVLVSPKLLKLPLDEVRAKLTTAAIITRGTAQWSVPEISDLKSETSPDRDFRMTFRQITAPSPVVVAEYVDGKLVFK